jgi:hypothetical protein
VTRCCTAHARRDRMSEVLAWLERNREDLDALAADVAEVAAEA